MYRRLLLMLGLVGLGICGAAPRAPGVAAGQTESGGGDQLEFSPEFRQTYERAVQAFNKNDFDETLRQLDLADRFQPAVTTAQNLRGAVYVRQKQYAAAQQVFAELCRRDAGNVMAVFNLGETYFLQKNYSAAARYFQDFVARSKTQQSLGVYKVFLCDLMTGREDAVRKILDDTKASPADPLYYYLNAAYRFKQGQPNEARGYLTSAFQIYPGQLNAAFVDSLIELGFVNASDLKTAQGAPAPVRSDEPGTLPVIATPAPPAATVPDISGLEQLLPSLERPAKGREQNQ
ncbi:MAG: hypothetical protein LBK76_06830 [Verrucomicrobiales bacterium]|jgi:tetratricopeptide (TPR) repeat protein|nr:hypothetical protein [Verrucomicrobiales bacterium]